MDVNNFIIFQEDTFPEDRILQHATSIYRDNQIKQINQYANKYGVKLVYPY